MTNVAVWGLGGHAQKNLLPALQAAAGVSIIGVWTRDEIVRRTQAERYQTRAYVSEDALLQDRTVDAVVLATPVGLHAEQGVRVLGAGKNLWCEKSIVSTAAECDRLLSVAADTGREVHELFMFLWHPQFEALRALTQSGELGDIRGLSARFGFPHLDRSNIRYDAALGGGALRDAGAYPYAAAHALLGGQPVTHAQHVWSGPDESVDTQGSAMLTYANGARAMLEWGFGHAYRNEITLWGSEGSAHVERAFSKPGTLATSIEVRRQDGTSRSIEVPAANHFERMFSAMDGRTGLTWVREQAGLLFTPSH